MRFETKQDVLNWYEKQPRALTQEFVSAIPWHEVKNHALDARLVPVLTYMRDVETLTEMYYAELRRTPTGRDPVIGKFMERWGTEELTHGELLNRFLAEAGVETGGENWRAQVKRAVSAFYTANSYLITSLTNLVGESFTATHMTFGAIHEMSTAQGYRRLSELARHPVLTEILRAVIREESAHTQFYWSVARLELNRSAFARRLARFVVKNFWTPVGQGATTKRKSDYLIATLFGNNVGFECFDRHVSQRVQTLPGFEGLTRIGDRAREIVFPKSATA